VGRCTSGSSVRARVDVCVGEVWGYAAGAGVAKNGEVAVVEVEVGLGEGWIRLINPCHWVRLCNMQLGSELTVYRLLQTPQRQGSRALLS
jgi:hypothetical protein